MGGQRGRYDARFETCQIGRRRKGIHGAETQVLIRDIVAGEQPCGHVQRVTDKIILVLQLRERVTGLLELTGHKWV